MLSLEWLKPLIPAIRSGNRAVIINCTDPMRLEQILNFQILERGRKYFSNTYYIDLLANKIFEKDEDSWNEVHMDSGPYASVSIFDRIIELLHKESTLVIMRLPLVVRNPIVNPETVTNFMYRILLDGTITSKGSFLIVVTPQIEEYFSSTILEKFIIIREEPASDEERRQFLLSFINKFIEGYKRKTGKDPEIDIDMIVESTIGLYPHEVKTAVLFALESCIASNSFEDLNNKIFEQRQRIFAQAYGVELEKSDITFEHVGGYNYAKEYVRKFTLRFKHMKDLKDLGIEMPRGLLLFGPPGTGKTYFVKALAGELNWTMITIDFAMFASKWYGETEQKVKKLLQTIDKISPVVVLLDELEQIAQTREGMIHEVTTRVVSMFNTWLADRRRSAFVVATANYPEKLDPAFIRAGRFDGRLPFLYPDADARRQILEIHLFKLRKLKLKGKLDEIIQRTEFYSGAELEALVQRAIDNALERFNGGKLIITEQDLLDALDVVRVNIDERKATLKKYIGIAEKFGTDEKVLKELKNMYARLTGRTMKIST